MSLLTSPRLLNIKLQGIVSPALLYAFTGREGINQLFSYDLEMNISEPTLTPDKLLGRAATVTVNQVNEPLRYFHGYIASCQEVFHEASASLRTFKATLVPALWFLTKHRDYRIFSNWSLVRIVTTLLKERGIDQFDISQLTENYKPITYCVQYGETDYQFIARLLADYGVNFFFKQTEQQCELCLVDQVAGYHVSTQAAPRIHNLQRVASLQPSYFLSSNYSLYQPKQALRGQAGVAMPKTEQTMAVHKYPGGFSNAQQAYTQAQQRLTSFMQQQDVIYADSSYSHFSAGMVINHAHLLLEVTHDIKDESTSLSVEHAQHHQQGDSYYRNSFKAIVAGEMYRPNLLKKVQVPGVHSALVVGSTDGDIYTDALGRVKLRFPWQRDDSANSDDGCWVRVRQAWAGQGRGMLFVPRVGDEVLVKYMDGDPDKPLVVGCMANAKNQPILNSPTDSGKSGLLFNTQRDDVIQSHLFFVDNAGSEQISLKSSGDLVKIIKNDDVRVVQQNSDTVIKVGNQQIKVLKGSVTHYADAIILSAAGSSIKIDGAGVHITAPKINFLTDGVGDTQPIARVGDNHSCPKKPHEDGPVQEGSSDVFVNGINCARLGDNTLCKGVNENDAINTGAATVKANGQPIARVNDQTEHGGQLTEGSPNVFIGSRSGPAAIVTDTPHSVATCLWPAASIDLTERIEPIVGVFRAGAVLVTYTIKLTGEVILQREGSCNAITFRKQGYQIEAAQVAQSIFSGLKLTSDHSTYATIGSHDMGDFTSTSTSVGPDGEIIFDMTAQPLDQDIGDWHISGTMGFHIAIKQQQDPPPPLVPQPQVSHDSSVWETMGAAALVVGGVVGGIIIAPEAVIVAPVVGVAAWAAN